MIVELKAAKRAVTGKGVMALRAEGRIPAVVYGPKQEATPIEMDLRDFAKVLETAGESTVVNLMVDGEGHNVLIHDVDHDPITNTPRHADFYAIVKGQKVEVSIPLEFIGESAAVKAGANLVKAMHEITIKGDPMHLPREIEVDLSKLANIGDQILASDLGLPEGVAFVGNEEEVIATVLEAVEEKLEEPVTGPDMSAIETSVEKGKKEEEGEVSAE